MDSPKGGWVGCSKGRPCMVCGRPNSKCRRRGELISCWYGDRYSPPADLRIGSVLRLADGSDWAVVKLQGGFGGNSLLLAPHKARSLGGRQYRVRLPLPKPASPPEPFWTTYDPIYRPSDWVVSALYQRHCLAMGWEVQP